MKLEQLLAFEDYKDGLKALYDEYDLKLGYEENDPIIEYPESLEDETTTEEDRQEYIKDRISYREDNNYIKTNYDWDMSQLWDFDNSIFKFILPRLYVFYKNDNSLSQDYGEDGTWKDILEAILDALLNILYTKEGYKEGEHDEEKINKGMYLLGKYIRRLWD